MGTETALLVNQLFATLQAIFPAFRQAWPTQPDFEMAKREWTKAFMQSGLTQIEQIRIGVKRFRLLDVPFVPSPGQFITMCYPTPEEIGLPPLHKAFQEAGMNSSPYVKDKVFSHPAVEHAWIETGAANFKTKKEQDVKEMFKRNYEASTRMAINGESFRTIPKGIEDTVRSITPGVAKSHLSSLLNDLKKRLTHVLVKKHIYGLLPTQGHPFA